jgi:osmotically-inducible protein OsmY
MREESKMRYARGHAPVARHPGSTTMFGGRGAHEQLDDLDIMDEVRERLFQDSFVNPRAIDVDVHDGVVTLRGEVRDFMEARYAWDDAWETRGVRGVVNQLTVRNDD